MKISLEPDSTDVWFTITLLEARGRNGGIGCGITHLPPEYWREQGYEIAAADNNGDNNWDNNAADPDGPPAGLPKPAPHRHARYETLGYTPARFGFHGGRG